MFFSKYGNFCLSICVNHSKQNDYDSSTVRPIHDDQIADHNVKTRMISSLSVLFCLSSIPK